MAAAYAVDMMVFDEKIVVFLKNTIQKFYDIYGGGGCLEYKHSRMNFLRNIVLEFENILDGGVPLDSKYRTWLSSCIIHIRDVRFGYGIRDIAYALLVVWYRRFPDEADIVMRRFVYDVGCWSDIKRLLGVWRELGGDCGSIGGIWRNVQSAWSQIERCVGRQSEASGVYGGVCPAYGDHIDRVIGIMIDQLWSDYSIWSRVFDDYMKKLELGNGPCSRPRACDYISIAAKWVPRENSRYRWLYDRFVIAWGIKVGWRGVEIGRWRKDFRKIISSLCREYQGTVGLLSENIEAKDLVRIVWEGGDDSEWNVVLDRFCSVCDLAIDTIPVVVIRYNDMGTDDFWREISYAILIAQRGIIGRFMLGDNWIVCRREDSLMDIVLRIRGVLGLGMGMEVCGSGSQKALDLLIEASEVSGYDFRDKLFYIGCRNNINI